MKVKIERGNPGVKIEMQPHLHNKRADYAVKGECLR